MTGWSSERVGTFWRRYKFLAATGFRTPDRPARSLVVSRSVIIKLVILTLYYICSSNNSVWELSNVHFTRISKRQWPCTDCFSLCGKWIRTLIRLDIHWIQWYGTTHAHKSDTRQTFAFRTYLFSMKSILLNAAPLSSPTIVDFVITFKEAVGFCETFGTCLPSYTAFHPSRL